MKVRQYQNKDYGQLIKLYKQSTQFDFDEVTDSKEGITRKIHRDPESILVTEEKGKIIGSLSIIEDGRIAWLFRLVGNNDEVVKTLISEAEEILRKRGYKNVHNFAPFNNQQALGERTKLGFIQGKNYIWFWKELY